MFFTHEFVSKLNLCEILINVTFVWLIFFTKAYIHSRPSLVSFLPACFWPSCNPNTSFLSVFLCLLLLYLLQCLLLFLVLQIHELQQTYLGYVLFLKCSLLHDCHWLYIVMCFFFFMCSFYTYLHFSSTHSLACHYLAFDTNKHIQEC